MQTISIYQRKKNVYIQDNEMISLLAKKRCGGTYIRERGYFQDFAVVAIYDTHISF